MLGWLRPRSRPTPAPRQLAPAITITNVVVDPRFVAQTPGRYLCNFDLTVEGVVLLQGCWLRRTWDGEAYVVAPRVINGPAPRGAQLHHDLAARATAAALEAHERHVANQQDVAMTGAHVPAFLTTPLVTRAG